MHCKICFFDNSFRSKFLDGISSVSEFARFRFREICESEFFCFILFTLISLRLAHRTFLFPVSLFPSSPSCGFPRAGFITHPPFFRWNCNRKWKVGGRDKFYAVMLKEKNFGHSCTQDAIFQNSLGLYSFLASKGIV